MPLPLTVSCFSKIQIGFTFLVPAHLGSPGKGPLNGCVFYGWEERLGDDLFRVEWDVKPCSIHPSIFISVSIFFQRLALLDGRQKGRPHIASVLWTRPYKLWSWPILTQKIKVKSFVCSEDRIETGRLTDTNDRTVIAGR